VIEFIFSWDGMMKHENGSVSANPNVADKILRIDKTMIQHVTVKHLREGKQQP